MLNCINSNHLYPALQDILLVVGPYGDWVNFDLSEQVKLVQEVDGRPASFRNTLLLLPVLQISAGQQQTQEQDEKQEQSYIALQEGHI